MKAAYTIYSKGCIKFSNSEETKRDRAERIARRQAKKKVYIDTSESEDNESYEEPIKRKICSKKRIYSSESDEESSENQNSSYLTPKHRRSDNRESTSSEMIFSPTTNLSKSLGDMELSTMECEEVPFHVTPRRVYIESDDENINIPEEPEDKAFEDCLSISPNYVEENTLNSFSTGQMSQKVEKKRKTTVTAIKKKKKFQTTIEENVGSETIIETVIVPILLSSNDEMSEKVEKEENITKTVTEKKKKKKEKMEPTIKDNLLLETIKDAPIVPILSGLLKIKALAIEKAKEKELEKPNDDKVVDEEKKEVPKKKKETPESNENKPKRSHKKKSDIKMTDPIYDPNKISLFNVEEVPMKKGKPKGRAKKKNEEKEKEKTVVQNEMEYNEENEEEVYETFEIVPEEVVQQLLVDDNFSLNESEVRTALSPERDLTKILDMDFIAYLNGDNDDFQNTEDWTELQPTININNVFSLD